MRYVEFLNIFWALWLLSGICKCCKYCKYCKYCITIVLYCKYCGLSGVCKWVHSALLPDRHRSSRQGHHYPTRCPTSIYMEWIGNTGHQLPRTNYQWVTNTRSLTQAGIKTRVRNCPAITIGTEPKSEGIKSPKSTFDEKTLNTLRKKLW